MREMCNDEKKIQRTPTIEKSYEHEVAVDEKKRFYLIEKLNKHPSFIAWDKRQLKVKLANINVSI